MDHPLGNVHGAPDDAVDVSCGAQPARHDRPLAQRIGELNRQVRTRPQQALAVLCDWLTSSSRDHGSR